MAVLEKLKRTNIVRDIGVVDTSGYGVAQQQLEKVKRAADNIVDSAFKWKADKLSKEAMYDAQHEELDYVTEYYAKGFDGGYKITDILDDKDELIATIKTPVQEQRLTEGKIYGSQFNKTRDAVIGLSIKASANTYADELYVKFIDDPQGYLDAQDAYLENVKAKLPEWKNDIELLEANVFSGYYKQIATNSFKDEQIKVATKLLYTHQELKNNVIAEFDSKAQLLNYYDVGVHWDSDKREFSLEGLLKENDAFTGLSQKLVDLNKSIQVVWDSDLGGMEKIRQIDLARRDIGEIILRGLLTNAQEDDFSDTRKSFEYLRKEISLVSPTGDTYIDNLKELVGYDRTIRNSWEELTNSIKLNLKDINSANTVNIKLVLESEMNLDLIDLTGIMLEFGQDTPEFVAAQNKILQKWSSFDTTFKDMEYIKDLDEYEKQMIEKYMQTDEGVWMKNAIVGNMKDRILTNSFKFFNLLDRDRTIWAGGLMEEFWQLPNDADAIFKWAKELYTSPEFNDPTYDNTLFGAAPYRKTIIKAIKTRMEKLDAEAGRILETIRPILTVMNHNLENGMGAKGLNPSLKEDRVAAEEYILWHDSKKIDKAHPLYGKADADRKISSNENMLLKFINNTKVLPQYKWEELNMIVYEDDANVIFQNYHFYKKVQSLKNAQGINIGEKIMGSIKPEAKMFLYTLDKQLQNYSPDNIQTVITAVKERMVKEYNLGLSNNFKPKEYYGTDEEVDKMIMDADIWKNLTHEVDEKQKKLLMGTSSFKAELIDLYKTNRHKGGSPDAAMDSAITHLVFFRFAPSKYSFSAMSFNGEWGEDKRPALLPPEVFFGGYDTDNDGKADYQWLEDFTLWDIAQHADWDWVGGTVYEEAEEKTETVSALGMVATKVTPAWKKLKILKYPNNPDGGYIDLKLGENLFLKAMPEAYMKNGVPMYALFYRQPDEGYLYWGQLKRLSDKDGKPIVVDIGEHFKKLDEKMWLESLEKAKIKRKDWLQKNEITYDSEGRMYIGGVLFTAF